MEQFMELILPFIEKCTYYFLETIEVIGEMAQAIINVYFPS